MMFVSAKLPKPAMAECRPSCVISKARTVVGGVTSARGGMDEPVLLAMKDGLEQHIKESASSLSNDAC